MGGDFLATTAADEALKNLGKMVVTPGEMTSIEITGEGLDVMKDRVMVIDCYGTCGVSAPSPSVSIPAKNGYPEWMPVNALIDRPSIMTRQAPEYPVMPPIDYKPFTKTPDKYCPGNKLPFPADTL